jgi:hypothetical protein
MDRGRQAPEPGVVPGEPQPARDRPPGDPPNRDPMPPADPPVPDGDGPPGGDDGPSDATWSARSQTGEGYPARTRLGESAPGPSPGSAFPQDQAGAVRETDDPVYLAEDRSDAKGPQADAPRWHGGVRNPDHPEFHSVERRQVRPPEDPLLESVRALTLDEHDSRLAGADIAGSGGRDPETSGTRADEPGDPRRDLPDARPGST